MFSAGQKFYDLLLLPEREVIALASSGFHSPRDLLDYFPKRYEDRRRFDSFPNQTSGLAVCLRGEVIDTLNRNFSTERRFFEAIIEDRVGGVFGSGKVTCRWFNMPYIQKLLAAGQQVVLYGKVKESNGRLFIDHPEFEIIREEDQGESIHLERIVPVYRNISGLGQRRLREIMHLLFSQVAPESLIFPFDVDSTMPRAMALKIVHFPDSLQAARVARQRFALEEFFVLQMNVVWRRARFAEVAGRSLGKRTGLLKRFYENLPFDLTNAQKRSIKEIVADMREAKPMNRLLQGDVGSGKTFVAIAAMLLAIDSGVQAALMAPTQILAEQHYATFCRWLGFLGIRIALRTSNKTEEHCMNIGEFPQIIIGTHALLYDSNLFNDLGLIVIDEQHKFGVSQRASLIRQGKTPDVLVMTATPIPRTLAITVYGDLDVSLLDEKPPGRGKIITAVRVGTKQKDVTKFVKAQLSSGRQAYLVYPLVEESETLNVESATEAFEKWSKRLKGYQVGMIHGKLKPSEKEEIMRDFREGRIAALVSTTVVEVGVDVPNASVMILHHAERFGLAQIHQLRGRIGRGGHKGYCVLLTDGKSPEAMEKLRVLERSSDGFEIAEADFQLRGPGDVLGTMQSGLGNLRFTEFLEDPKLLREARAFADRVISEDPTLTGIHGALRAIIDDRDTAVSLPGTA